MVYNGGSGVVVCGVFFVVFTLMKSSLRSISKDANTILCRSVVLWQVEKFVEPKKKSAILCVSLCGYVLMKLFLNDVF